MNQRKKSKSTKDSSASPIPPAIVLTKSIPEFLLKRGITRVIHNIPEGMGIALPPGTFALFFEEQVLQELQARRMSRDKAHPKRKRARSKKSVSGLKKNMKKKNAIHHR